MHSFPLLPLKIMLHLRLILLKSVCSRKGNFFLSFFFFFFNVFKEFETDKDRKQKCWSLELKLLKKVYYNGKTKCLEDGDSKTTEHSAFQGHRFPQIARVRKDFSCFLPYSVLFQVLSIIWSSLCPPFSSFVMWGWC